MSPLYTMETYGRLSSNQDMGGPPEKSPRPRFSSRKPKNFNDVVTSGMVCVHHLCCAHHLADLPHRAQGGRRSHHEICPGFNGKSAPPFFFFVARPDNGKPFSSLELFFRWLVGGILHMGHWRTPFLFVWLSIPKCSMYGIFMYIYHKFKPFM